MYLSTEMYLIGVEYPKLDKMKLSRCIYLAVFERIPRVEPLSVSEITVTDNSS